MMLRLRNISYILKRWGDIIIISVTISVRMRNMFKCIVLYIEVKDKKLHTSQLTDRTNSISFLFIMY